MRARRVSLILMAINLGLVGTLAYMVYAMQFNPATGPGPVQTKVITNTITQIAVRKINSTNNLMAGLANRLINWHALESTNYPQYIQNLRNFGCPEETVRDIIIADVAKSFGRRRAELRNALQPYRFWQTADPLTGQAGTSPQLDRAMRQLDQEQRQLVRELLAADYRKEIAKYSNEGGDNEQVDAFLAPERLEQVRAVTDKFEDQEQEVYARSRGLFLPEDQEALRQIQRQRRAELAGVLSAQELEEYDLRHSETANNMRSQLAGFQPTEEEFRKVFRLQHDFDDTFDQGFDARDDAGMAVKERAQQDAQAALNEEVRKTLGQDRFSEYQRAQDLDYRALVQLSERYDLPADAATRVYNMKQAAELYKTRVATAPNLSEDQRSLQAMEALARETERAVASTLGENVFKNYQHTGGQWLGNLQVADETFAQPQQQPQQPTGTTLPYDINLLPPDLRNYLLNPPVFPQPGKP